MKKITFQGFITEVKDSEYLGGPRSIRVTIESHGNVEQAAMLRRLITATFPSAITIETAEEKKPVKMCDAGSICGKPAQWLTKGGGGTWYHCNEHVWRGLGQVREGTYTITPISPEPPEPIVEEREWDFRDNYHATVPIPLSLRGKRLNVTFKEVPD